MNRNRVNTNLSFQNETWNNTINGTLFAVQRSDVPVFSKYSVMSDAIHGKVNRPESPCIHRKIITTKPLYPDPPLVYVGAGANRFDLNPPSDMPIGFHPESVPEPPTLLTQDKWNSFLESAFEEFTEQFTEKLSIANFIIELKDFGGAIDEAKKICRTTFGPKGGFFRSIGEFLHGRAKNGVGGNILDLELNWKSFVGDLPKIFDAYGAAMRRLQFLIEHQHFTTHKRIRFQINDGDYGFDPYQLVDLSAYGPYMASYQIWLVPSWGDVTFNASAFVDNHLQLEDVNSWWAVADVLGLNNSPRIIWNAIKLSWVADMFLDTEEFLDAFEVEAYNGTLAVKGGNASYKIRRSYDMVAKIPSDSDIPYDIQEIVVGSVLVVDYMRTPVDFIKPSLFRLKPGLNTHQQYLLTSLADAQSGLTAGSFRQTAEYAGRFRKNLKTFGKSYWKGIHRRRRYR